jgi:hypothetical protein
MAYKMRHSGGWFIVYDEFTNDIKGRRRTKERAMKQMDALNNVRRLRGKKRR